MKKIQDIIISLLAQDSHDWKLLKARKIFKGSSNAQLLCYYAFP